MKAEINTTTTSRLWNSQDSWHLFLISQDPRRTGDLEIYKTHYLIGRDEEAADGVIICNPMISRVHCRIDIEDGTFSITDLNSSNGTKKNTEEMIPGRSYPLTNGDLISIAGTEYVAVLKYEMT